MDTRVEVAKRAYEKEKTLATWSAYLQEMRRVGQPEFSPERVASLCGGTITNWMETQDGFEATVESATEPRIEETYRTVWDDVESGPIWDYYDGKIILSWDTLTFAEIACPTLKIQVTNIHHAEALYGVEEHVNTRRVDYEYIYEHDCVDSFADLLTAFADSRYWTLA